MNRALFGFSALCASFLAIGCHSPSGLDESLGIVRHANLWSSQNVHNYSFQLAESAQILSDPLAITVRADTVAGVIDLRTGAAVSNSQGKTITGLFSEMQQAVSDGKTVTAAYDSQLEFPLRVVIDCTMAADCGVTYTISQFAKSS